MASAPHVGGKYGTWASVKIPGILMERIDEFLASTANRWGYRSKQDVVANAVREFLRRAEDEARGEP